MFKRFFGIFHLTSHVFVNHIENYCLSCYCSFSFVCFCCFCCFCCCCCCYYCFCEITKIISPSLYALDLLKMIVKQVKQFMRPFPTRKMYLRLYDPPYRGKGGVRPMHGGHPTVQKLVVTIFCLIYFSPKYLIGN